MTPQEWFSDYLEQGGQGEGGSAPASAPSGGGVPLAARGVRRRLAEGDTWAEPPDGLLARILAEIESDRALLAGSPGVDSGAPTPGTPGTLGRPGEAPGAPPVQGTSLTTGRPRSRGRRLLGAATAAAALAAAVVIGVVVVSRPAATQVTLAGTRLAPAAHATATVHETPSGLAIVLDVGGLPPSAPGSYYQAWMKGPKGLVTIGTFHLRGGPGTVDLWSAVSRADYPTLTVTREPADGNPASSGAVVLTTNP